MIPESASKDIKEFSCCPHCGNDFGYYKKVFVSGRMDYQKLFENHLPYNPELYSSLKWRDVSVYYYCIECNKKITKIRHH